MAAATPNAPSTISKATLGLRFMQNALRTKQMEEIEAERAVVKDDGGWEIDPRIRAAWGPEPSSSSLITHEPSYLPFLFPSVTSPDLTPKLNGRRVFNQYGIEEQPMSESEATAAATSISDQTHKSKVHSRPTTISVASHGRVLSEFQDQSSPKPKKNKDNSQNKNTKSARDLIHETSAVGKDLHQKIPPSYQQTTDSAPEEKPAAFLKPAGVDDPLETRTKRVGAQSSSPNGIRPGKDSEIIQGGRSKPKRQRTQQDELKRKTKKKRSSPAGAPA